MNTEPTNNIPATLQPKIEEYLRITAKKIDGICRRNKVSRETATALITDITSVMQAKYAGFVATPQQMQELAEHTTYLTWNKTENAALAVVASCYLDVAHFIVKGKEAVISTKNVLQLCEIAKAIGAELPPKTNFGARMITYIYCVLFAAEECEATKEELLQIEPNDSTIKVPEDKRKSIVASALDMQRQKREILATIARKREKRNSLNMVGGNACTDRSGTTIRTRRKPITDALPIDATILQYQNIAYALSKGMQTADNATQEQKESPLRPLWQAIEDKRKAAEEIIKDKHALPMDIERAQSLITNTTAIYQTMRGIQILPQVMLPESGSTTGQEYRTTPRQFAIYATGSQNPNQSQVDNCMRALDFLSTQRMEVQEEVMKRVPKKDSEGKTIMGANGKPIREYKAVPTYTRFNPCTTTFYGEYNETTQAVEAKEIVLHPNNIIIYGKSAERKSIVEADGKEHTYLIAKPQAHRLPLWQVYEFSSDEEIIFENALLSKPKRNEEDLLKEVFAYDKKQAAANKAVEVALAQMQALADDETASDEEKKEAQLKYRQAKENATDCITKHIGRDKERLQAMFQKAQDKGILKYWYKEPQAGSKGKRIAYNYIWSRFTDEEIKKHRQKMKN